MEIRRVTLQTASLEDVRQFYVEKLGLPLLADEPRSCTIAVGNSELQFTVAPDGMKPFYHLAFNIPENQVEEAHNWLRERVTLLTDEGNELIHFVHWDAHSLYFLDPAGNILELIARHRLQNRSERPFDQQALLCISEIGLPVDDVWETLERLQLTTAIPVWREPSATFATMGDQNGLFVLVAKGREWFMGNVAAAAFPLEITVKGERNQSMRFKEYVLRLVSDT